MKVLVIFGTRPEAIKMAPVIRELRKYSEIQCRVCVTAQHREMLDQVLDIFDTKPDYDLNLMKCNQNLSDTTATVLKAVEKVLINEKPDLILVQGDTTTTFASSLAAFYQKIKIVMNYISHKIQSIFHSFCSPAVLPCCHLCRSDIPVAMNGMYYDSKEERMGCPMCWSTKTMFSRFLSSYSIILLLQR